jgi:hypothetical protein
VSKRIALLIVVGLLVVVGVSRLMGTSPSGDDAVQHALAPDDVEIVPAAAFTNTTLSARRAGARGGEAELSSCTWYVNGVPVTEVTAPTLDPSYFKKGDEVVAEAVTDPEAGARRSAPVVIAGTPPQMNSGMIDYDAKTAKIVASASASDADGDPLEYRYAWLRNDAEVAGQTGATLDVSGFKNGDRILARISVHDGESSSSAITTNVVALGSDAPAITSTPPQSAAEGGRYVYQVETTHDPGSLSFELVEAPAGMTIDENGRIEWSLPQDQEGEQSYPVAVRVSHPSGGETTQHFTIGTGPVAPPAPAR